MEAEEGGGAGKTYWSLFIFHFSFLICSIRGLYVNQSFANVSRV